MAWWGHPFSITFHISGTQLNRIPDHFSLSEEADQTNNILIGVNKDQWVHHFETSNYISVHEFQKEGNTLKEHSSKNGFLKLAIQINTKDVLHLPERGIKFMNTILEKLI